MCLFANHFVFIYIFFHKGYGMVLFFFTLKNFDMILKQSLVRSRQNQTKIKRKITEKIKNFEAELDFRR
jgi:hypothetical protein